MIDCVSGYSDHCHCLVSLRSVKSISQIAHRLKGESSTWINKNKLTLEPFKWQSGYLARSVSPQEFRAVRAYIHNQGKKHSMTEK